MTPTVLLEYTQQRESSRHSYQAGEMMSRKKQRVSKGGRSSAFVPDNRLAVETVAESEGLGSSYREDTEMTASEDSCSRKRKCISLNDGCDRFGVPIQVVSVSKMSESDKKKAQMKFRGELNQIRDLQKRIDDAWMIHGVAGNIQRPHGLSNGQGKRRPAAGRGAVAPPKRGATGRFESANQQPRPPLQTAGAASSSNALLFKLCRELLKKLMSHHYGWVFNTAVDVEKLNIPDYYTIIKKPMDLGTVKENIEKGSYSSPLEFAADVRLTFSNAKTYNPAGNDVHFMADYLDQYFEARWKAIEKKIPSVGQPKADVGSGQKMEMSNQAMEKNNSSTAVNKVCTDSSLKRVMTASDKQKLIKDVEGFDADIPDPIIKFLQFHCHDPNAMDEDEIELDFEALSDDILFKLRKLIDDHFKASRPKVETSEVEVLNESGVSNSSMRPCKDNDPADEDVDICGNEPLIFPRFPPVEIEKDTAEGTKKCSSSSSSSSDSESSSSDSDTASSSDSDSDHVKVSSPGHATKENAGVSAADLDQEQSALLDPLRGNDALSVVDHDKSNIVSADEDRRLDGENAQSERQVSPEKLYRAALLRNRFADTIRKAREKTLNQGGDPEKLRLEREELERQQREDKARLDAEAKAALDALQRAELEAAAEARRQRELDRVASRLALQQMHKTVDLSDTSQFLKDLAMMGSVPGENISCSLDENSPEHVFDGMGSFKLGKSNPLEQLGLFMKDDVEEEDEDEDEGNLVASAPNDVEEGEID